MEKPKGWRRGQYYVNLLDWMEQESGIDPFYIEDKDFDEYEKKFLELYKR